MVQTKAGGVSRFRRRPAARVWPISRIFKVIADLYIDSARVPGDPGVTEITAHQIGVGRLRRSENMDEWVLSPVFPLDFETVTFWDEADKREAVQSAKGWIENHILTERDDLDDLFE